MAKTIRTILFVALCAAAVAAVLAVRPADPGPRPGPLWEPTGYTAPAASCAHPAASWDEQEPAMSFAVAGDSVLGQVTATGQLRAAAEVRCHTVTIAARSGGAPCDLLPTYGAVMSAAPSLRRVALAWVGNVGASPCMVTQMGARFGTTRWGQDPNGPATLTAAEVDYAGYLYEVALRAMVRWNLAHNVSTVLVLPPPMRPATYFRQTEAALIGRYTTVANAYGGVWATGLPRLLLGGGTWQATIGGEPVRNTDYVHLRAPFGTGLWAQGIVEAVTTP